MTLKPNTTVLIIPGLREHVEEHWQTLLAARLPKVRIVPPIEVNKLSCSARVEAIQQELDKIEGPVILVAHSAGVLMVAHWAVKYQRKIKGALLAAPPDLNASWPDSYPSPSVLSMNGWSPVPQGKLPFPSIIAASNNDHLASIDAVKTLAELWGSQFLELGDVGHLNPASGFGDWPLADSLISSLDK